VDATAKLYHQITDNVCDGIAGMNQIFDAVQAISEK